MGNTKTEIATQELIDSLKGRIREIDNYECLAASGRTADESLQEGFNVSNWCRVASINGVPFCAFGVNSRSLLGAMAVPWMLGTDDVVKAKRSVVKLGKKYTRLMLKEYDILYNFVAEENVVAIKWLENCGFIMEDAKPIGLNGEMFKRFWITKEFLNV